MAHASGTAGEGVEVDLCLAERARGDVAQAVDSAAGMGVVLIDPAASPAR